jgi:tetratricopeptide (TPR) repeat protein
MDQMYFAKSWLTLANLSLRLSEVGRREEALRANDEALRMYRRLAANQPTVFYLARSLSIHFDILFDLRRIPEALLAIQEAASLHRPLAKERPIAFAGKLTSSLFKLSSCYSGMGRHEDAQLARTEAEIDLRLRNCASLSHHRLSSLNV